MKDSNCRVMGQTPLAAGYWALELEAAALAPSAQPGQFVHIRIPGLSKLALRRPFSIFEAQEGKLRILYKTVGHGTEVLSGLRAGEEVQVLGPLGNGFPLKPEGTPLLVAGGYGVAPLCFLASRLNKSGVLLIGGRTAGDILECEAFERLGWRVEIATQDGSKGTQGLVTVLLDKALARLSAQGEQAELYACGPDGMLRAVGAAAISAGCRGWLSLDKHMVCGVGACLACVQKLRRTDGTTWIGRVCRDGPIFEAREIVWS